MSDKHHILFFADALSVHTQRWVGAMAERGWRCSVVSRHFQRIAGADVHPLETPDGNWPWFAALPRVRRLAAELAPDIVHGHYITSYGLWAAACRRRPVVLTGWGSDILVTPRRSRLARIVTGWTLRRADLVTADSQDMLDEIARYRLRAPLHQIYWGADTDKFRPYPSTDPVFRIVSPRAWEPNYNIDVILDATARLRAAEPGAAIELHLLGGGSLEPRLRSTAQALGLDDVVHFHGRVDEDRLAQIVNGSHVCVSIPDSDATSVALLESMASGLPVVVSDLPANRQWIDAGGGWLLPPRDPAALAQALRELLHDPARALEMGRRNRSRVDPQAARRTQMDRMDALYRRLLEGAAR